MREYDEAVQVHKMRKRIEKQSEKLGELYSEFRIMG